MDNSIKLIVFDLDGTLINSLGSTVDLMLKSLKFVVGQEFLADQIVAHFGLPEEKMFSALLS